MMNWVKSYYTRKDTRWNFWKEDMKIALVCYGIMVVAYYGYIKYSDWKDRKETNSRIKDAVLNNEELQAYMKED